MKLLPALGFISATLLCGFPGYAAEKATMENHAIAAAPLAIDINTASAKELAKALEGIGKSKAAAIVAYRETHGPFASVEELVKVPGIGKKTVANIGNAATATVVAK